MANRKKKQPKQPPVAPDNFDSRHHAGTFNLRFLKPRVLPMVYEDKLLTAEEKASYYEELVRNNGIKNSKKIARDCRKMAAVLKQKVGHLDPDEALPILEEINGLEFLADSHANPIPPDVLASQKIDEDAVPNFPLTPSLKNSLVELGLAGFSSASNKDAECENSDLMLELRRKARFWKNIHTWSTAEQMAYYFCGPVKPADWTEAVFVRAQKHRGAINVLSWEARHSMMRLLTLAEMGNEDAVKEVVDMLEKFVRLLNLHAKTNPQVFKKVAGRLYNWPVVYSPHPKLNQIPLTISKQIGLGADIDYVFDPGTEWHPNELGCKIVMHLYEHIKLMRQHPESNEHSPFFKDAMALPDIKQPGSVGVWWVVAEKVLRDGFPVPEENEILRQLTKMEDRSKANSKIREILKNRFFTLFDPKYR